MEENKKVKKESIHWNGAQCDIKIATPLHGYRRLDTYEVVIKDLQTTISKSSGKDMYVMTAYIVLAYDAEEHTLVCDKRRLYKAGDFQMQEVRDALVSYVAGSVAKSGEKILFLTDEVLIRALKGNNQAVIAADVVRGSNGQLQITLLC